MKSNFKHKFDAETVSMPAGEQMNRGIHQLELAATGPAEKLSPRGPGQRP